MMKEKSIGIVGRSFVSQHVGCMGFRKLEDFNLALLPKQGCRLMHNQQSLFYRVFKAKYFPNVRFLKSSAARNPYFAQKGSFEAKKIQFEGCRWRVVTSNRLRSGKTNGYRLL